MKLKGDKEAQERISELASNDLRMRLNAAAQQKTIKEVIAVAEKSLADYKTLDAFELEE